MKQLLILAPLVTTLLIACTQQEQNYLLKKSADMNNILLEASSANIITIKSVENQPIAGAQILVGTALNLPFAGNLLTTNSAGQAWVPVGWDQSLPITVQAPGYVRTTYMQQEPGNVTINLHHRIDNPVYIEVKGLIQDLPVKNGDDQFDSGIVIPAFSKLDMFSFNIDKIISPQSDRISVFGQNVEIPSNLSLPKQNEWYSIANVVLDKPAFRTYFPNQGIQRVVSLRTRVPFSDIVSSLRAGKSFLDVINKIKLNGAGVRDLNIQGNSVQLNLPTSELNFTEQKNITSPSLANDETFLAVGLSNQSGLMIPTDIKTVSTGRTQTLNLLPNSDQRYLAVLKKTSELKGPNNDRISAALLAFGNQNSPKLLALIEAPRVLNLQEIQLPPLNPINGVYPLATYAVISSQVDVQQGPAKTQITAPKWEIYSANWISSLSLPQWPEQGPNMINQGVNTRFEVTFVGSQTASQTPLGPAMIEAATHVTHSSTFF